MTSENRTPPIEPAIPPMPTTAPSARFGNRSDAVVKRFADQPWCAAAASPTIATATHRLSAYETNAIGNTQHAQMNIAVLRAAFTLQPARSSAEESQPPPMLPTVVIA